MKKEFKHKAWSYCSKCGFGNCKHLEEQAKEDGKYWTDKAKELDKVFSKDEDRVKPKKMGKRRKNEDNTIWR